MQRYCRLFLKLFLGYHQRLEQRHLGAVTTPWCLGRGSPTEGHVTMPSQCLLQYPDLWDVSGHFFVRSSAASKAPKTAALGLKGFIRIYGAGTVDNAHFSAQCKRISYMNQGCHTEPGELIRVPDTTFLRMAMTKDTSGPYIVVHYVLEILWRYCVSDLISLSRMLPSTQA